MTIDADIAKALGGEKGTPAGWLCKCPCHDDNTASLSLKLSDSGKLLVNCLAGCNWKDIYKNITDRGLLPTRKPMQDRYAGARFYVYKDLVGNVLCRKVKLPSKKMWFERYESGKWVSGLDGMTVPLYNLQEVVKANTVYLCEGEKDAETINNAKKMASNDTSTENGNSPSFLGLVGTTNHAGATSWAPHLTEQLRGKCVVIIPDNDEAGRKRVSKLCKALQNVAREIRVFCPPGVAEHGDVTDWVNAGGDCFQILGSSTALTLQPVKKKATHDEYYELFETALSSPRKCIFNEKLMFQDATGLWNPAINALDRLKAAALIANETKEAKFNTSHIQPFFFAYEASCKPEFLVDIPEWDGQDRISAMAYLMKLKPDAGITEEAFSELLKEWCALMFQRLHDPMIQNRILVLQGGQGIGKDTWTSMLVDGLGQFSVPLNVVGDEKDTYLQLHRGLVMKISEFDKTSKTEVSTLKDIITAPKTDLRAPYDKDARLRLCRCSFISSANVDDILRDYTGNRRFMIFEVESIEFAYAGWDSDRIKQWQMQCLAEMVHLAQCKYTASEESWRMMREYIESKTPGNPSDDMLEHFLLKAKSNNFITREEREVLPTDSEIIEILNVLSKETGLKIRTIKLMIQSRIGVYRRIGAKRFWVWRIPANGMIDTGHESQLSLSM